MRISFEYNNYQKGLLNYLFAIISCILLRMYLDSTNRQLLLKTWGRVVKSSFETT